MLFFKIDINILNQFMKVVLNLNSFTQKWLLLLVVLLIPFDVS
jgi:hypothetical protein